MAQLIAGQEMSQEDKNLLEAFAWDRFTETGGGAVLAANARYAASMHPVHSRTSGLGVAAAVGTELGSYSTARSAAEERQRDRASFFTDGDDSDDSLERAALMGKQDSIAYTFGGDKSDNQLAKEYIAELEPYEGSPDALTISARSEEGAISVTTPSGEAQPPSAKTETASNNAGRIDEDVQSSITASSTSSQSSSQMDAVYQRIKENKAKQTLAVDSSKPKDERPDPGFRIYYEDPETGEGIEVPPYTSPGVFQASLKRKKEAAARSSSIPPKDALTEQANDKTDIQEPGTYDETTFDGYQTILALNSRGSRDEELEVMKAARQRNRLSEDSINMDEIGAVRMDEDEIQPC